MKALKFVGKIVFGTVLVIGVTLVVLGSCTAAVFNNADDSTAQTETTSASEKPKTDADKSKEQLYKEAGEPSEKISKEYANAQGSAQSYSDMMSMSKDAIQTQLVDFDKFPEDAAKYAVEHITVDWNKNALSSAKSYQENLNMSNDAIQQQLVDFDKFTPEQAQYAVENLDK